MLSERLETSSGHVPAASDKLEGELYKEEVFLPNPESVIPITVLEILHALMHVYVKQLQDVPAPLSGQLMHRWMSIWALTTVYPL